MAEGIRSTGRQPRRRAAEAAKRSALPAPVALSGAGSRASSGPWNRRRRPGLCSRRQPESAQHRHARETPDIHGPEPPPPDGRAVPCYVTGADGSSIRQAPTLCSTSAETLTAILRAASRSHTTQISWPPWPQGSRMPWSRNPWARSTPSTGPSLGICCVEPLWFMSERIGLGRSSCSSEWSVSECSRRQTWRLRFRPPAPEPIWTGEDLDAARIPRPWVAVSMSDLALRLSEGTPRNRYVDEMARLAQHLRSSYRASVFLVPHEINPPYYGTDDRSAADVLAEGLGRPAWMHSIRGDYGPSVLKGFIGECRRRGRVPDACRHCRPFLGGADASRVLVAQVSGPDGGHRTRELRLGSVRRRCWKLWTSSSIGSGSGAIACENGCATIRLEPGDRSPACARASLPASRAAPTWPEPALPLRRARRPGDDGRVHPSDSASCATSRRSAARPRGCPSERFGRDARVQRGAMDRSESGRRFRPGLPPTTSSKC